MARTFISGVALAVAAALAIAMDSALGLGLGSVLFGVAVGGALGLSVDGSAAGRAGAYAVGVVVAVAAYLVRVLLLPDSSAGLIVFAVLAVLVTTAVCALTGGGSRCPGGCWAWPPSPGATKPRSWRRRRTCRRRSSPSAPGRWCPWAWPSSRSA